METLEAAPVAAARAPADEIIFLRPPMDAIEETWPVIARMLQRACARTRGAWTPDAVLTQVRAGQATLWVGITPRGALRAAAVTTIYDEPAGPRIAEVVLGEGRKVFRHLDAMYGEIERWAVEQYGAVEMQIIGRRGWARRLKGFKEVAVVMRKPLMGAD